MESKSDEVSPSRSDLVIKTRRQSTLLDSPCRVTRSQVKRISNAHVNPPSPKPAAKRRHSVKVQEAARDTNNQDGNSPTEQKGSRSAKGVQNLRRVSRRFSSLEVETVEDDAVSSQGSQLESIHEQSKPITRRTRSSMKVVNDTDSELSLPTTRRTRQSSVSSVASTSTIASSVASPMRRTRGRRNLSPVPSVSASEVSIMSEIQEASPDSRKRSTSSQEDKINSSLRRSSNSSPTISSAKSLRSDSVFKSSPGTSISPTSGKSDTSFTSPRKLQLGESDTVPNSSPRSKRLSAVSLQLEDDTSKENLDVSNQSFLVTNEKPRRRSSGRLSLSSASKFVETPLEELPSAQVEEHVNDNLSSAADGSLNASYSRKSLSSTGRLSLSSNKSSPAKFPQFSETPMNESPKKIQLQEEKSPASVRDETGSALCSGETKDRSKNSRRSSSGRLSLSSGKPVPVMFPKFEETPLNDSPKKIQLQEEESPASVRNETGSPQCAGETKDHSKTSRRSSSARLSLSSGKLVSVMISRFEETPLNDSPKKIQLEENKSADTIENKESDFCSPQGTQHTFSSQQKSCRSSNGRLSTSSNTSSPAKFSKLDTSIEISPEKIQLLEENSFDAIDNESYSDSPQHTEHTDDCSQKSRRMSSGRLSLSSNKPSPAKFSKFDEIDVTVSPKKIRLSEQNSVEHNEGSCDSGTPKSIEPTDEFAISPDKSALSVSSSPRRQSTDRCLLNSSMSSRFGVVQIDDTSKEEDQESRPPLVDVELLNKSSSNESPEKSPSIPPALKTNRASTGRLSIGKSTEPDVKVKSRASAGGVIDKDVSHSQIEFKTSPKLLQTESDEESNFEESKPNQSFSEEKGSPGSKSDSSLDSNLELKVNSSVSSQKSPNSTKSVKDEQECVSDFGLMENPVLSKRKSSDPMSKRFSGNEDGDDLETSEQPYTQSKISRKVLKDAAYLLSGGDVYDSGDSGSDDNQWQLVFSPSAKTKKEARLEKKAKKRAEKESRKKSRVGRLAKLEGNANNTLKEQNLSQCETNQKDKSPSQSEEVTADFFYQSEILVNLDSISDSASNKSLLAAGPDNVSFSIIGDSGNSSVDVESRNEAVEKKKNKKRKHVDESISEIVEEMGSTCLEIESEIQVKKQRKSTDSSLVQKKVRFSDVSDVMELEKKEESVPPCNDHDGEKILKKKKKKKGKDKLQSDVDKSSESNELTDFVGGVDTEAPEISKSLSKKKKRTEARVNGETNSDVLIPPISEEDKSGLKKKKKKICTKDMINSENLEECVVGGVTKKNKKKKKKEEVAFMVEDSDVLQNHSDVVNEKKMKKKHKKQVSVVEEDMTHNGSDSDDAPASVSFAAGKQAALAELQAAAESIRKQKEVKREKLRLKQEKIKEEKLAKTQKLMKKQKHLKVDNISLGEGSKESTSEIYFRKHSDLKIANPNSKPPKRLPDDLLESLSEQPPSKLVRRPDGSKERVAEASLSKEQQERLEKKRAKKLALKLEKKKLRESDYIPLEGVLGSTRFGVVPLRNIMLAKKLAKNKLAAEATNFRKENLFGSRIRRTPISTILAHQEKLKASGKDRLVGRSSN